MPFIPLGKYIRFGGLCCYYSHFHPEDGGSRFPQRVASYQVRRHHILEYRNLRSCRRQNFIARGDKALGSIKSRKLLTNNTRMLFVIHVYVGVLTARLIWRRSAKVLKLTCSSLYKHDSILCTCATHLRFPSTDGGRMELQHWATGRASSYLVTEPQQRSGSFSSSIQLRGDTWILLMTSSTSLPIHERNSRHVDKASLNK